MATTQRVLAIGLMTMLAGFGTPRSAATESAAVVRILVLNPAENASRGWLKFNPEESTAIRTRLLSEPGFAECDGPGVGC